MVFSAYDNIRASQHGTVSTASVPLSEYATLEHEFCTVYCGFLLLLVPDQHLHYAGLKASSLQTIHVSSFIVTLC